MFDRSSSSNKKNNSQHDLNDLPLTARPISQLKKVITRTDENETVKKSANSVLLMRKLKQTSSQHESLFYFKFPSFGAHFSVLETYCATICRFLATADYVPSTRSYYDDDTRKVVGSASKSVKFTSNYDDPLTAADMYINCDDIKQDQARRVLIRKIEELHEMLTKDNKTTYYQMGAGYLQGMYDSFFSISPITYHIKPTLLFYKQKLERFSSASLEDLSRVIQSRKEYLLKNLSVSHHPRREIKQLTDITQAIDDLKKYPKVLSRCHSIESLDKIDLMLKKDNLNLENLLVIPTKYLGDMQGTEVSISDIKNYRILKGLATTLTTRFIFKEGDLNNSNFSKDGTMLDFDWTKINILYEFKELGELERRIKRPTDKMFACTERNVRYFPDIENSGLYYWPTKQPEVYKIIIELLTHFVDELEQSPLQGDPALYERVSTLACNACTAFFNKDPLDKTIVQLITEITYKMTLKFKALMTGESEEKVIKQERVKQMFKVVKSQLLILSDQFHNGIVALEDDLHQNLGKKENMFSEQDNNNFKQLATNPVVIFHRFKTFLKYALTDTALYDSFAHLNIVSGQSLDDDRHLLSRKLVQDEAVRIIEVRTTLLSMPEFKDFLRDHGKYVFEQIKNEFIADRDKYAKKVHDKPYYAELINALDIDELEKKFDGLCVAAGVSNVSTVVHHKKMLSQ